MVLVPLTISASHSLNQYSSVGTMTPNTSVGINYGQLIISNCLHLGLDDGASIRIVTGLDTAQPGCWTAYVVKCSNGEHIISAKGNSVPEAFANLHEVSARRVDTSMQDGSRNPKHLGGKKLKKNNGKRRRAKTSPALSDFLESSSNSDGEDNMSDGSASTTSSRSDRSTTGIPGAIFTPPMSTDSTTPPQNHVVTHQRSLPGWTPPGSNMPWRPCGPAPPPRITQQRTSSLPKQEWTLHGVGFPVLFIITSPSHTPIEHFMNSTWDYETILEHTRDILMEKHNLCPLDNQMWIKSVQTDEQNISIAKGTTALPFISWRNRLQVVVFYRKASTEG